MLPKQAHVIFSQRKVRTPNAEFDGRAIEHVNVGLFEFLGFNDSKLNWQSHCNYLCEKLAHGILVTSIYPVYCTRMLYFALVY